jgi:hypothetical protein
MVIPLCARVSIDNRWEIFGGAFVGVMVLKASTLQPATTTIMPKKYGTKLACCNPIRNSNEFITAHSLRGIIKAANC